MKKPLGGVECASLSSGIKLRHDTNEFRYIHIRPVIPFLNISCVVEIGFPSNESGAIHEILFIVDPE